MGWFPLLGPKFEEQNPEAFYEYVKGLHKPHKPEIKVKKTKRSSKNDNNSKLRASAEEDRETKADAGAEKA